MKGRFKAVLAAVVGGLIALAGARPLLAQNTTTLWVDEKTGQVFIRPGAGRVPMTIGGGAAIQQLEQKTNQMQAQVAQAQAQQQADHAAAQKQINQIKPAWTSYMTNFQDKFRIGTLAYLDYSFYTHTGFGPQWNDNLNPPGVGNNEYNSFDISRVYLNTYFTPTKNWTFRFTPEIYRAVAGTTSTSADTEGTNTSVGTNIDGDLNLRLKYAYVQNTGLWDDVPLLKGGNVTFGAQPNPLLGWEEDLTQYRFVYQAPWSYLGLSSSQIGLQFNGPVKPWGAERTYFDYGFGVYDNGSFRTPEQTDTKQVMARITAYPFGAKWRYDGLGLTGFYNYGYGDVAPNINSVSTPLKASDAHFTRAALILSYAAIQWNLLGEFDYGDNAFNLGNLYSGSGPNDAFGTATGTPITTGTFAGNSCSAGTPCYPLAGTYGPQVAAYKAILQNGRSRNVGFDMLGRWHIPNTKFTVFGMYQWFMPNDNINQDPLDFERFIAGISYQYNEYLRFALDSQNLLFYHSQFSQPVSYLSKFNYVPGSKLNGELLPKTGSIPFLVPRDMHTLFLNMEFAY